MRPAPPHCEEGDACDHEGLHAEPRQLTVFLTQPARRRPVIFDYGDDFFSDVHVGD